MLCPKAPANSPLSRGHDRLRFNPKYSVCDWPGNVDCDSNRKLITTKKTVTARPAPITVRPDLTVTVRPSSGPTPVEIPRKQKVCFESKGDKPGTIRVLPGKFITQLKISHQRGRVTCDTLTKNTKSRFGCSKHFSGYIGIVVADSNRKLVFPPMEVQQLNKWGFYKWQKPNGDGVYDGMDKKLILDFETPYKVSQQTDELYLWYGEDFLNVEEAGNRGRVCTRVEITYQ